MLLSYDELMTLVNEGVISNVDKEQVQGSSIDLTLGPNLLIEAQPYGVKEKDIKKFFNFGPSSANGYDAEDPRGKFPEGLVPDRFLIDVGTTQPLNLEPYALKNELYDYESCRTVGFVDDPYVLRPNEFLLGQTNEIFNLPDNISAQYHLRSSLGRIGLEHLNAGWCDPGWTGSVLTLELKNISRFHFLKLTAGCPIGQLTFFRHKRVPKHASYQTRGRYNNDKTVSASKEIK